MPAINQIFSLEKNATSGYYWDLGRRIMVPLAIICIRSFTVN
jgi:hypothetical protein